MVYHQRHETAFPVSVDLWLGLTRLSPPGRSSSRIGLAQAQLLNNVAVRNGLEFSSDGTRSRAKLFTFSLVDVAPVFRDRLASDPSHWVTYVHSYPNKYGGVTLQYWRAYAWNEVRFLGIDFGHGGDWEGILVHLNKSLQIHSIGYLQHSGIAYDTSPTCENTHPVVWSEAGSHSTQPGWSRPHTSQWIRQETWVGGAVTWWDGGTRGPSGGLVNLGEKSNPRGSQHFVRYSGIWGSRNLFFLTSGYWGPAFNETGATCPDGSAAYAPSLRYRAEDTDACRRIFISAWCDGMADSKLDLNVECFATNDVP